jgi:hypothetical protein
LGVAVNVAGFNAKASDAAGSSAIAGFIAERLLRAAVCSQSNVAICPD